MVEKGGDTQQPKIPLITELPLSFPLGDEGN